MLKCKACGCMIEATKESHYIARDPGIVCPTLYDAFDCPNCGVQCIVGERKYRKEIENHKEDQNDDKS